MLDCPEIRLTGCQIKSLEKARIVASALHTLEVETGIRVCEITLDDCFICPDIDEAALDTLNRTPMERTLRAVIRELRGRQQERERQETERKRLHAERVGFKKAASGAGGE